MISIGRVLQPSIRSLLPKSHPKEPDQLPGCISPKRQKRFWAIAKGANWSNGQIAEFFRQAGIAGTRHIKNEEYDHLIERFQKGPEG